jgi:hypothetical protein
MPGFTLTTDAIAAIKQQLRGSRLAHPFVTLGESSDGFAPSDEFISAITSGADDEDLKSLGKAEYERIAPGLKLYLAVLVYDFDEHRPQDLLEIAGIPFSIPSEMRSFLDGYELDHSAGRFVLRKGALVYENLRSLPGAQAAT